MKVALIILGALLIHSPLWAKGFIVNWACPTDSSSKTSVEVYYDEAGKLVFNPDIFTDFDIKRNVNYSDCIAAFQKKISEGTKLYKERKCPQSRDSICASGVQYTNDKVLEKIRGSYFMKKVKDVRVAPIVVSDSSSSSTSSTVSNNISSRPAETAAVIAPEANSSTASATSSTPPASAEAYLESKLASKDYDLRQLNRTFAFQGKNYKVSDFDQVIAKNIDPVFSGMSVEEGRQFAQNYMVAKSEFLKEGSDPAQRKATLDNLNRMFGKMYGSRGAEELAKMLECNPDDNLTPINEILNKLQDTQKIDGCRPLEPGQHKVFTEDKANYYSTGDYLLKRKSDGNYQAFVNVDFQNNSGRLSPQAMMQRSKECLHEASPFIKGPDGKRIELMMFSSSEIQRLPFDERPKNKVIKIENPEFATNAGAYAEDVGCPTIVHEVLHLLGLCDEYKETRPEYGNKWSCRVVPKADSIMRNHVETYNKAVGTDLYCTCKDWPCASVQKSSDPNIKRMLNTRTFYDITDHDFRTRFCTKPSGLPLQREMANPYRTVLIQSETADSFVVENRTFSGSNIAPNYKIDRAKLTCTCYGNQDCLAFKRKLPSLVSNMGQRGICPNGSTTAKKEDAGRPNVVKFRVDPIMPSLLHPNQFTKILNGNCTGVIDGYLQCADWAYKGTDKYSCNAPSRCSDDSYYLGISQ